MTGAGLSPEETDLSTSTVQRNRGRAERLARVPVIQATATGSARGSWRSKARMAVTLYQMRTPRTTHPINGATARNRLVDKVTP